MKPALRVATLLTTLSLSPANAAGEARWMLDLEVFHARAPTEAHVDGRYSVLTLSAGAGAVLGRAVPYAMVAVGLLTLQLKLGAWFLPRGVRSDGAVARVEVRPEVSMLLDGSVGVMLSLGAGYRWARPGGVGRYVLVTTEAGPAALPEPPAVPRDLVRRDDRPEPSRGATTALVGFSVALGVDW